VLDDRSELVVTTLDPLRRIPLVRYRTGDWAEVLTHAELAARLERSGQSSLVPRSRLPLLALWGRGGSLNVAGRSVHVERVKQALYADAGVCAALSGRFRLEVERGAALVRVERRERGPQASLELRQRLERALAERVDVELKVRWEEPASPGFPSGFDRKMRYVD
jgi:phenylacetate-coenzyme A ligase PaaK-like adenylate-forming protein